MNKKIVLSKNKTEIIGFAGLTHLGLNSAVASAAKGFSVVGYHDDEGLITRLSNGEPHVLEPQLSELMNQYRENLNFSSDLSCLASCDIVYIAVDVPTDDEGKSDLTTIKEMVERAATVMKKDCLLVVLCQVPPGFTRSLNWPVEQLFYQVETLIFGRAMERALHPERFILGCADPNQLLQPKLFEYLNAFECPLLPMRYESAELAKISINMCLVATISAVNTLAEICENIGADWSEIVPALQLDKRIGKHSYLNPGLGISGGNLERDLNTVITMSKKNDTDAEIVTSWIKNSNYRKNWPHEVLYKSVLKENPDAIIGVLGLTYKENTHSIKNSPALLLIKKLEKCKVTAFDPAVNAKVAGENIISASKAMDVAKNADAVLIMTAWPEFKALSSRELAQKMKGRTVIDPYRMLDYDPVKGVDLDYFTLGMANDIKKKQVVL